MIRVPVLAGDRDALLAQLDEHFRAANLDVVGGYRVAAAEGARMISH